MSETASALPALPAEAPLGIGTSLADAAAAASAASSWLSMYDRAKALGTEGLPEPPKTDIALVYAGGMTPDPWTVGDMHAQTARYFLPTWVARGTGTAAGHSEAEAFLLWLHQRGAPRSIVICLDLETRGSGPDLAYEAEFRRTTAVAGYFLMLYGSSGNLFEYPATAGGYFVANPPAAGQAARPHMYNHPGVVATQWRFAIPGEDWDLSVVDQHVRGRLWDRHWTTRALALADHIEAEAIQLRKLIGDYARS